jgi:hypothetical protein
MVQFMDEGSVYPVDFFWPIRKHSYDSILERETTEL